MKKIVIPAACIALALMSCTETLHLEEGESTAAQTGDNPLQASIAFSETQPSYLRPADADTVPAGIADLKASTCGSCHTEIYEEWRISTHARAWADDPQFQAEFHKPRAGGSDVTWMCRNCHTPLRRQQPNLVIGLQDGALDRPIYEPNPHFDAELQQDAITCASCHVRDGVVLGPFGDTAAPHPVKKSEQLLSNKVCTNCHQAEAWFKELALACVFDTGTEFEEGPYAKEGFTCQQCHMPEVQRPLVVGGQPRATRRHWFGGSMIPKQERFEAQLSTIRKHYPEGLTTAWIDPPKHVLSGSAITLSYYFYNKNAGHRLPTGDPERFLLVTARIKDATGATLAEHTERIGALWEWSPQPRQISDNRLAPRERRTRTLKASVPNSGPLTLELEASKWRINEANLDYHQLRGKMVPGRIFYSETTTIEVR